MVFNDDIIFIHIGKTGGMSCSAYLLRNLRGPVYNCHLEAAGEKIDGATPRTDVARHCTLQEALSYIGDFNGKTLGDFAKVIAVIRHPYELEYSFYKHLQKPRVRERRKQNLRLLELAAGDFETFSREADLHRKGHTQDAFLRVGAEIPSAVELIRFEDLSSAFPRAVAPFVKEGPLHPLPHHNHTQYDQSLLEVLTPAVKDILYEKHRFMFDSGFYSRTYPGA